MLAVIAPTIEQLLKLSRTMWGSWVLFLSLLALPLRRGGDAPGVDLMASLTDVQLLTIKTLLASDATRGAIRTRKQSSVSGKESAQGCVPQRLLGRPD